MTDKNSRGALDNFMETEKEAFQIFVKFENLKHEERSKFILELFENSVEYGVIRSLIFDVEFSVEDIAQIVEEICRRQGDMYMIFFTDMKLTKNKNTLKMVLEKCKQTNWLEGYSRIARCIDCDSHTVCESICKDFANDSSDTIRAVVNKICMYSSIRSELRDTAQRLCCNSVLEALQ